MRLHTIDMETPRFMVGAVSVENWKYAGTGTPYDEHMRRRNDRQNYTAILFPRSAQLDNLRRVSLSLSRLQTRCISSLDHR